MPTLEEKNRATRLKWVLAGVHMLEKGLRYEANRKQESDKAKAVKDSIPEPLLKEMPRSMPGGRSDQ
ncbi:UNVERIFIED_CONTAM: hypothetical protein Slati_1425900 [Sesamum latifolium]|uniref:Uncharacterized protein n=1 Tax=Sesamum latifolium TaxID=2727402 RepID=A0AAW2X941_9LAMI